MNLKSPVRPPNTFPEAESGAWYASAWTTRAACAPEDMDPELWFSLDPEVQLQAKAICVACPVLDVCLKEALAEEGGKRTAGRYGILGGLLPNERFNRYMARLKATRTQAVSA